MPFSWYATGKKAYKHWRNTGRWLRIILIQHAQIFCLCRFLAFSKQKQNKTNHSCFSATDVNLKMVFCHWIHFVWMILAASVHKRLLSMIKMREISVDCSSKCFPLQQTLGTSFMALSSIFLVWRFYLLIEKKNGVDRLWVDKTEKSPIKL